MKVPPLIINLKNIEKHKKHKKHKKHRKHHHKHHHNNEHHSQQNDIQAQQQIPKLFPPVLEPIDTQEREPTPPPLYIQNLDVHQTTQQAPVQIETLTQIETPAHNDIEVDQTKETSSEREIAEQAPVELIEAQPVSVTESVQQIPTIDASNRVEEHFNEPKDVSMNDVQEAPQIKQTRDVPPALLSFLEMCEGGNVRMKIIGPESGEERSMNLENVCGRLQDWLDVLPSDIEDDMHATPVNFVEPPAFGSHLPINDSTFANISKEESEILLDIYGGNPTCLEYAESIQRFAKGTNYVMNMTDSLLNHLTDGKHKEVSSVQNQLNEIDLLLEKLSSIQHKRLSASASPIKPDDEETNLADDILTKMTKLIKERMKPGELCDSKAIFKALGLEEAMASLCAKADTTTAATDATVE